MGTFKVSRIGLISLLLLTGPAALGQSKTALETELDARITRATAELTRVQTTLKEAQTRYTQPNTDPAFTAAKTLDEAYAVVQRANTAYLGALADARASQTVLDFLKDMKLSLTTKGDALASARGRDQEIAKHLGPFNQFSDRTTIFAALALAGKTKTDEALNDFDAKTRASNQAKDGATIASLTGERQTAAETYLDTRQKWKTFEAISEIVRGLSGYGANGTILVGGQVAGIATAAAPPK